MNPFELEPRTATATAAAPSVAICVATCLRPAGLTRLLGALGDLRFEGGAPELRLVVVDNDSGGSARAVCEALADRLPFPVQYLLEKRRGISQARNAALAAAMDAADFVAFLDDDEVPEPDWLAELLRVQRLYDADAVTGPYFPRFERPPPAWIREAGFFESDRWPTGRALEIAYTGNVLIRSRTVAEMGSLFDERLTLTGGEDSDFFQRFARAGHTIIWCDTARVHDAVPEACASLRWILARAYRMGATSVYIQCKLDPGMETALRVFAHGVRCIAKGALMLLVAAVRGRAAAAAALHLVSFGAGRMGGVFDLQYAEYRTVHGH